MNRKTPLLLSGLLAVAVAQPVFSQEKVMVYTSMKESLMGELREGFKKKHPGVEFDYYSAGAGKVMAKLAAERQSGNLTVDVLWHSEVMDFLKLKNEGMLEKYQSPEAKNIKSTWTDPEFYWTPARLCTLGIAYNTKKVSQAPKNWSDLHSPLYKGKFVVANPSLSGTSLMSSVILVNKYGWGFFEKLKANEAKVGQGSGQVVDDTAAGAFNACIAVDYIVLDKIKDGANLGFAYPPEMVVMPSPAAIMKGTKNLAGARKFMDFLLSKEGQAIVANAGTLPARTDVPFSKEIAALGIKSVDDVIKRALFLDYPNTTQVREPFIKKFEETMR